MISCNWLYIAHLCALKATLTINCGMVLDQWAWGLSVMLEKLFGCALITKLWLILLMEADFNTANKNVYGQQMLDTVRKYNLMPEEICSKKIGLPMMALWSRLCSMI